MSPYIYFFSRFGESLGIPLSEAEPATVTMETVEPTVLPVDDPHEAPGSSTGEPKTRPKRAMLGGPVQFLCGLIWVIARAVYTFMTM